MFKVIDRTTEMNACFKPVSQHVFIINIKT